MFTVSSYETHRPDNDADRQEGKKEMLLDPASARIVTLFKLVHSLTSYSSDHTIESFDFPARMALPFATFSVAEMDHHRLL
jgi:hypothetical protein